MHELVSTKFDQLPTKGQATCVMLLRYLINILYLVIIIFIKQALISHNKNNKPQKICN